MQVLERENLYMIVCQSHPQIFTEQPDKSRTVPSCFILGILCGKCELATSLVVSGLESKLPMQGALVGSLVRELDTTRKTEDPACHR